MSPCFSYTCARARKNGGAARVSLAVRENGANANDAREESMTHRPRAFQRLQFTQGNLELVDDVLARAIVHRGPVEV